jgi:hypothetical protein
MGKPAEIKTKETSESVEDFINTIEDDEKRKDCLRLINFMQKATKEAPKLWGNAIIGFGKKRYKSPATGREVDWFKIGFSPRKANISLNLVLHLQQHKALLEKLGKHKAGMGCLYINRLADIDIKVLQEIIKIAAKTDFAF